MTTPTIVSDPTFKIPVLCCSLGFFFIFMAFNTTQALATSLSKSLANACFASLYGVFAIACMVAPRAVNFFGPKNSMVIGAIAYAIMIFTYVKPTWATSLPAHILVGLGAPLLWTGSGIYISRYAKLSAQLTNQTMSTTANYLNGTFFSLFHFNGCTGLVFASIIMSIWGSKANVYMFVFLGLFTTLGIFILSLLPKPPKSDEEFILAKPNADVNTSLLSHTEQDTETAHFVSNSTSIQNTVSEDSVDHDTTNDVKVTQPSIIDVVKLIIFNKKMAMMSALILYNGVSLSFMFGDLSGGIIGKAVGTKALGFILASYYLWNTLFTILFTKITTTRTKPLVLCLFVVAHTIFLTLLYILPQSINFVDNPDTSSGAEKQIRLADPVIEDYIKGLLYCFFFSIGDSILQMYTQSLLQTFFAFDSAKSDQAMSAMKLVQSAGIAGMFVLGVFTSDVNLKIRIVSIFLAIAFLCLIYIILNWVPMTENVLPEDELTEEQLHIIVLQSHKLKTFQEFVPLKRNILH